MIATVAPLLSLIFSAVFVALMLWRFKPKPAGQWLTAVAVAVAMLALNVADFGLNGSGWSLVRSVTWLLSSAVALTGFVFAARRDQRAIESVVDRLTGGPR